MATFHLNVTTGAGTPIYRQIIDQVRLGVATGALRPGQAMPSVRSLAERLVVNANTVVKAYAELVRDGVLEAQQGMGFFVAEKRQIWRKQGRTSAAFAGSPSTTSSHEAVFSSTSAPSKSARSWTRS